MLVQHLPHGRDDMVQLVVSHTDPVHGDLRKIVLLNQVPLFAVYLDADDEYVRLL